MYNTEVWLKTSKFLAESDVFTKSSWTVASHRGYPRLPFEIS